MTQSGSTASVAPPSDVELAGRLRLAVGMLGRWLRQRDPGDLSPAQVSALAQVDVFGPLRIGDLAVRERVAAPTITRVVGILTEAGLVQRTSDPDDRRSWLVSITPAGRRQLDQIRSERVTLLVRRLAALSGEDRNAIAAALPVLESIPAEDHAALPARLTASPQLPPSESPGFATTVDS